MGGSGSQEISLEELEKYDGREGLIYVCVNDDIFDVSEA